MYKERNRNLKSSLRDSQAKRMPGRDSARAKLIHSGQSPLPHIETMKSLPRK